MDSFKSRVKKVTVFDDRLVQKSPVYAINRGCQDMKINVIPASSSNASNIQCLIQPPSYRTNVDKYISISTDIFGYVNVRLAAAGGAVVGATTPILVWGRDASPQAFPLHQGCVYNMDVEINDQKFQIDSDSINQFILRMMNSKKLAMERTCPNMLDKLVNYNDGYAVGSGSTVTQATSRTTGVTINAITGSITLVSAAGSTTYQSFTVTNSAVTAKDVIIVNQQTGTDLYIMSVTNIAAGSFKISFATTGGTTTETPILNFAIIKGQTN